MFILGYFIEAVAKVIHYGLNLFVIIIIARAILSWVNPDPFNPIVRFINQVTEPILFQIRRRLPVVFGGMDFSPILVILVVVFLDTFLFQSLMRIAINLTR